MGVCPYCRVTVRGPVAEVQHTQARHPDVIERHMLTAGYTRDPAGQWRDELGQGPGTALRFAVRLFPPGRSSGG